MAETEMVERVARAIFDRECKLSPSSMRHAYFDDINTKLWYCALARAAIEAMRTVPQDADAAGVLAAMEQVAPFIEKVTEQHGFNAGSAARVACGDGRLYRAWYNAMIDSTLSPIKK